MATLKELKSRRKSTQSIKKVTSAMKMIAASKLKRSQDNMIKARPYSIKIKSAIQMLVFGSESFTSEFFIKRPGNRTLYIPITSDKGLCGGFNSNIIKAYNSITDRTPSDKVIVVGNKIIGYMEKTGIETYKQYPNAFTRFTYDLAADIGSVVLKLYKENQIDRAVLIYNRFQSAIAQVVVKETILPIELDENVMSKSSMRHTKFLTEPTVGELFDMIFPKYVNFLVWRGLLESYASENAARMATMDSATENAKEMIDKLSLDINKARQAAITQEISEIVAGSGAY